MPRISCDSWRRVASGRSVSRTVTRAHLLRRHHEEACVMRAQSGRRISWLIGSVGLAMS